METATVLSEGVFGTTYGKTANGLVRFSQKYRITSVIDSRLKGKDAGEVLQGRNSGIPIVGSLEDALKYNPETLIVGIASDGGLLPENYRPFIRDAIATGMNIVSGLHDFISDDREFSSLAMKSGSRITDVRKLFRDRRDQFTGRIKEVGSYRIAVLGTDSAIGKRTTAIILNNRLMEHGNKSSVIGTGQTSWMQGIKHTIVLDAIVNDFVSGCLETVTYESWKDERPDIMFLEGQGSVIHPAYPGSYEIIGACRPDSIILQHAPKRLYYDGFHDFQIPPVRNYIKILELLSGKKVIGISLNTEGMNDAEVEDYIEKGEKRYGIPVFNPLKDAGGMVSVIEEAVN